MGMQQFPIAGAILVLLVRVAVTDDQFSCCMSGMKQLRGVDLCRAPCCPGYYEVIEKPPLLSPMVYCKALAKTAEWKKSLERAQRRDSSGYAESFNRYYLG